MSASIEQLRELLDTFKAYIEEHEALLAEYERTNFFWHPIKSNRILNKMHRKTREYESYYKQWKANQEKVQE